MTPWRALVGPIALTLLAGVTLMLPGAQAQVASLGQGSGSQPVEILADDGIEWHRESQRYLARGNASATQGETSVHGDVLIAYYRSQPGGGTEIFRYEVQGRARITNPTQTAVGDKAVYDIDTGVLVMTGKALKITTPTDTITARDSLEYWEKKRVAVARGDAVAVSEERRMTGDVLTAHFVEGRNAPAPTPARPAANTRGQPSAQQARGRQPAAPAPAPANSGGQRMQRIEGFGNVHVSTPTDIVRSDRGVYNADTSIAMMSGNVRITRGQNQLNGDFAEVNLNTGISRLLTRADSGGDKRVRALFLPNNNEQPGERPAARREQR
jgi:lipopolysaccharide export system protein LptA